MSTRALILILAALFPLTASAAAQQAKASGIVPCCNITAVDPINGLATATDNSTGKSFRFKPATPQLMKSLKLGQAVTADFKAKKVRVDLAEPVNGVIIDTAEPVGKPDITPAEPVGKPSVNPIEPCCNITQIDGTTGVVTARDKTTGRTFRFDVKDGALLKTLKVGQTVFADFGTSKVRIHGLEPCCNIIGHGLNKF